MHEPLRTDEFICNSLEFYDFHMNHKITVMFNEKGKSCSFNDAVGCYDYTALVINELCVWGNGGMTLTGENRSTGRKHVTVSLRPQ
jgi:hypothetical protein